MGFGSPASLAAPSGIVRPSGVISPDGMQFPLDGWTPAELFGGGEHGVWLDADDLSTLYQDDALTTPAAVDDVVGGWANKSGQGYDATQATATSKPRLRSGGGLHWVEFDGVDDWLRVTFGVTLSGINTVALAARRTGGGNYLFDGDDATHRNTLFISTGVSNYFAGTAQSGSAATDAADHVWRARYAGASSTAHYDGAQDMAADTGSQKPDALTIGARYDDTSSFAGRIYALVTINRALTGTEAAKLDAYLARKGGVSL